MRPRPQPKPAVPPALILLLALLLVGVVGGGVYLALSIATAPAEKPVLTAAEKAERQRKQAQRLAFIQRMQEEGVIDRIEVPGSLPRMWVTVRYLASDFKTKETIAGVVFAYQFPDGGGLTDMVRIYENLNGKEVGKCTRAGLTMF